MQAKREFRDREDTEVAVLDALVDRTDEGMTVFELRSGVDVSIDELERALASLKTDGLIHVENEDEPMRIYPAAHVVPDPHANGEPKPPGLLERLRDRFPF